MRNTYYENEMKIDFAFVSLPFAEAENYSTTLTWR